MSMGYYLADVVFLTPAGITVENLAGQNIDPETFLSQESSQFSDTADRTLSPASGSGTVFDQVLGFSQGGFQAVWDVIGLMTGTYFLSVLGLLGVPAALQVVLQLIFGFIAVRTLIYFILGR